MFGLQKQRRNAVGGGAWFIAGHLTVFAKLSHHAVPLESRIFSSRCFSFSVPPLPSFPLLLVSLYPLPQTLAHLPPISYVTIRRKQHTLIDPRRHDSPPGSRNFLRKIRNGCERISVTEKAEIWTCARDVARILSHVCSLHNFCNGYEKKGRNMRYIHYVFLIHKML